MRLCWLLLCVTAGAGDWDWTLNSDSFLSWEREPAMGQGEAALSQRLRLNLDGDWGEHFYWQAAYEAQGIYRENLFPFSQPVFLRLDGVNPIPHRDDDTLVRQQVDRLHVGMNWRGYDLVVGRQAVGHGNARFFNHSDVFAPLTPFSLNAQYKAGIDGIKLNRPFAGVSEWSLMAFFPEKGDGLILGRLTTNYRGVDWSFLGGKTYGEWTAAWDVACTWLGAAWYTEGIWRKGDRREDPLRLMAGVSRRFGSATDLSFEISHHNLGRDNLIHALLFTPEWRHGEMFLLRETHVALAVGYELTPLMRLIGSAMAETDDRSAWMQLGLDWDVSQRASCHFGALMTAGGGATEFGAYADAVYVEYRLTLP